MKKCAVCKQPNATSNSTCSIACRIELTKRKKEAKKTKAKWDKARGITAKKCDKLWSEIVRSIGRCEYCGKTEYLNAHHIYGRRNFSLRWDIENGVCLCAGHHTMSNEFSAHQTPVEFTHWIYEKRGEEFMQRLIEKKNIVKKPDFVDIFNALKEKHK